MKSKNLKTIVSLVVVVAFFSILMAGFGHKGQLAAPASAAAPVTSIAVPTSVQRGNAVLSWSPVAGATGYIVQFFSIVNGKVSVTPSFSRNTTTPTYKIVTADNVADNVVYGWNVIATSARSRSIASVTQYFKITPVVATQRPSSILISPRFFVSDTSGVVYEYNTTQKKWNSIAGTALAPKIPVVVPTKVTSTTVFGRVTTAINNTVRSIVTAITSFFK